MSDISRDLIDKLKKKKVDTFFGVQGGACARLIEDVIKSGGRYYPVLNEQTAGYAAHGYYLATKKNCRHNTNNGTWIYKCDIRYCGVLLW